jgi:hypothetical protein
LDRVALDQQQDAMTNDERRLNAEMTKQRGTVFCHFDFVILSGFVIYYERPAVIDPESVRG